MGKCNNSGTIRLFEAPINVQNGVYTWAKVPPNRIYTGTIFLSKTTSFTVTLNGITLANSYGNSFGELQVFGNEQLVVIDNNNVSGQVISMVGISTSNDNIPNYTPNYPTSLQQNSIYQTNDYSSVPTSTTTQTITQAYPYSYFTLPSGNTITPSQPINVISAGVKFNGWTSATEGSTLPEITTMIYIFAGNTATPSYRAVITGFGTVNMPMPIYCFNQSQPQDYTYVQFESTILPTDQFSLESFINFTTS
jgi:hypothetical protein